MKRPLQIILVYQKQQETLSVYTYAQTNTQLTYTHNLHATYRHYLHNTPPIHNLYTTYTQPN